MPKLPTLAVSGATIPRQVLRLAGPVVVEQALLYLVLVSDTVLTGRYFDEPQLAAVTVATYLLWFLGSLLTIVSVGATALVARLVGSKQREHARRITQQSILLALAFGVAVAALGWPLAPQIVRGLALRGVPAEAAALFLRIVLPTAPLLACTTVGIACLRGAGDTRAGMWVMIAVNAINVSVSWSLVGGFGPLPRLGFSGIAIGTACAEGTGGVIVLCLLARGRSGLGLALHGLVPVWDDVNRILRVSLPAAGESLSNNLCQLWFVGLINRLGPVATAGHGVAIRCESIAFLTVTAFAVAAGTLTGQYLGAGRPDLAERAARTAWALGVAVLCGLGILLYTQAEPMFRLFLGGRQAEVAQQGIAVLRVVAFALPALATISVVGGALRGAGDTRWPWLIVVLGYLLVRIPLTYWFTAPRGPYGLGWGLYGAWLAMFADLNVRAAMMAGRFLQGGWRRAEV